MNYPVLSTLNWDGTIWHDSTMGVDAALLPTGGYPTAHAPALLELPIATVLSKYHRALKKLKAQLEVQP